MYIKLKTSHIISIISSLIFIELLGFWLGIKENNAFTFIYHFNFDSFKLFLYYIGYYLLFFLLISLLSQFIMTTGKGTFFNGLKQRFILLLKFGFILRLLIVILKNFLSSIFLNLFGPGFADTCANCIEVLFIFIIFLIAVYVPLKIRNEIKLKDYLKVNQEDGIKILLLIMLIIVFIIIELLISKFIVSLYPPIGKDPSSILHTILDVYPRFDYLFELNDVMLYSVINISVFFIHIIFCRKFKQEMMHQMYTNAI